MLNDRELASSILLLGVGLFIAVKFRATVGPPVRVIGRQVLSPRLLLPFSVLVAYVAGIVVAGARVGAWDRTMLFGTVVWFAIVAVTSYVNIGTARTDDGPFVRRVFLRTIEISAVLEFIAGIFVFSLPVELVLQTAIAFVAMLVAVASGDRQHAMVARAGNGLLGVAGITILTYSAIEIWTHRGTLELSTLARQAVLPVWLTIALVPLLYLFGLFVGYDSAARRLWRRGRDLPRRARLRALLALVLTFRGRRASLRHLDLYVARQMVEAETVRGAMAEARKKLEDVERRAEEFQRAEQRLIDNAGMEGTDEEGRRLDQREFAETRDALTWLQTCHMGHYRNRGKYRSDLLTIVEDSPQFQALSENDHGIRMVVSDDGQTWWAWRTTVTGWVLGIGASGPPPTQFLYDALEEPTLGPEGDDNGGWTSVIAPNCPPNW